MNSSDFTALLIEDDARDVTFLEGAFSELGLAKALRTLPSLDRAVEYLTGKGEFADRTAYPLPSLILVSLPLARTRDFTLLRWIQRQEIQTKRIPVVMLAAARQPAGFGEAQDLGAITYLVKPVDLHALHSMIQATRDFWRRERTP